jgi:hypothetical protein
VLLLVAVTEIVPDTALEPTERLPDSVTVTPWKLNVPLTGGSLEAGTVIDGTVWVSNVVPCPHDTVKLGSVPPVIGTFA